MIGWILSSFRVCRDTEHAPPGTANCYRLAAWKAVLMAPEQSMVLLASCRHSSDHAMVVQGARSARDDYAGKYAISKVGFLQIPAWTILFSCFIFGCDSTTPTAADASVNSAVVAVDPLVAKIKSVEKFGKGNSEAQQAVKQLS